VSRRATTREVTSNASRHDALRAQAIDGRRFRAVPMVDPLALRIEQLEFEEWDAIRRRDWSTARGIAQERVALKETHQRTVAASRCPH
jgi:hypothetical protein